MSAIANALGLSALAAALYIASTGKVILISLFVMTIAQVTASRMLSDTPYRLNFRSPFFRQAFRFGYPLMFSGIGLAASNQGDRFVVGGMLGLSLLGIYAVATLVTVVPMLMLGRILSTVLLAAFYNAERHSEEMYNARLRAAAVGIPTIAAIFSLEIVTLYNLAAPLVFGSRFALSPMAVVILAIATFLRIARGEPFTTMLINQGRTRQSHSSTSHSSPPYRSRPSSLQSIRQSNPCFSDD